MWNGAVPELLPTDRAKRAAVGIWATLILLTVLVLSRRIAGAFHADPPAILVVGVAILSYAAGLIAAMLAGGTPAAWERRQSQWLRLLLSVVPPFVFGLSLTGSGATGTQMSVATLAVLSATAILLLPGDATPAAATQKESEPKPALLGNIDEPPAPDFAAGETWLSRRYSDDGANEFLEGAAVAEFAAGQKLAVVHVAFCPPTFGPPEVECEPLGESDVRWKLSVAQPFGLRIDVTRRGGLDRAESIPIGFFASAPTARKNAA